MYKIFVYPGWYYPNLSHLQQTKNSHCQYPGIDKASARDKRLAENQVSWVWVNTMYKNVQSRSPLQSLTSNRWIGRNLEAPRDIGTRITTGRLIPHRLLSRHKQIFSQQHHQTLLIIQITNNKYLFLRPSSMFLHCFRN